MRLSKFTNLDSSPCAVCALCRESRRQLCNAFASRTRILPLPYMPVYINDRGLEGPIDEKRATSYSEGPTPVAAAASVAVHMVADTSGKQPSGMEDKEVVLDVSASAVGGMAGMRALLRILVSQLSQAAISAEAGPLPVGAVEAVARPSRSISFAAELGDVLKGGSLDSGRLGPALARFSAAYLFHMQQELHAADQMPGHAV